jgi:RNA recognition motif-containing protein
VLLVSNLHAEIGDAQLREIFAPFGPLERFGVLREPDGSSRGFGRIRYGCAEDAHAAVEAMNGFSITGRCMHVRIDVAGGGGR